MDRRTFLKSVGAASAAGAVTVSQTASASPFDETDATTTDNPHVRNKTWLFWDLWHVDRQDNVELCQGQAELRPEATYVDNVDGLAAWPSVFRDPSSGRWRMVYTARWKPYQLMVLESDDGVQFAPLPCDQIVPEGDKLAPHHVFTLPHGSCGGVYLDPVAADGFRFKVYGHQQGPAVFQRAKEDPRHRWHDAAQAGKSKSYMAEELTLVSRDGLHWETRVDMNWGQPHWHPEPPIFGFYNRRSKRHMMTVRPGWGDRRVCIQSTQDFVRWSGPELLLQPDALDGERVEHYGMPVFPYEDDYVGLLWVFHNATSEPTRSFNRFVGWLDCQLAYSFDGLRFFRGRREPLIALTEPGEHGCGGIEPSSLVVTDDEIRIYSCGSKAQHGTNFQTRRAGEKDFEGILLHTLRKDGFTYLRSRGSWASFITKPLVLFGGELTLNAGAPWGEVHYQLTDVNSEPLAGYTFDDCVPLVRQDSLTAPLRWREKTAAELAGTPLRLQIKFRDARLYAVRGSFHFLDAQDWQLLKDGQEIHVEPFEGLR
jgi:hypothetical protein